MTKTLNALTKVSINHRDNIFIQKKKKQVENSLEC